MKAVVDDFYIENMRVQMTPSSFSIAFLELSHGWSDCLRLNAEFDLVQFHCKDKEEGADVGLSKISNFIDKHKVKTLRLLNVDIDWPELVSAVSEMINSHPNVHIELFYKLRK
ncbi:unnamed protein product [Ambrosiozyma monospora]|uniref:Unnamed protein product n=1 Tax=Ambrosiozyma monospora TaxID=43982 RepID=A0ACB5UD65_AMBMO|nr:unnamed protein product [Ambrosiozyma monospora]